MFRHALKVIRILSKVAAYRKIRYIILSKIQDHTGMAHAATLQQAGSETLGRTANELYSVDYAARFGSTVRDAMYHQYLSQV